MLTFLDEEKKDSYRWIIVLGGVLGLFAALGIGRFSLGMMLPAMGDGLGLSYTQMGIISTVNFCGYLAAVLMCGVLTSYVGSRALISLALLLIALSMGMVGMTENYYLILVLYCLTGVGSALANVPIMAVISMWFDQKSRGRAAGLCVMGNGIGILLSGKLVPLLNGSASGWRLSWLVLASIAGMISILCFVIFRERTKRTDNSSPLAHDAAGNRPANAAPSLFYHCGVIYFLFGFSYVVYVTFFVTALVQDRGFTEQEAGTAWAWVGMLSLLSGPLFGYLSDLWGRKKALLLVFFIQLCAYLLLALPVTFSAVYLSACFFAIALWAVPTIMAALIGDLTRPERTAAMFGFVTFLFGIGQIGGPIIAGYLAEKAGHFNYSFLFIAIVAGGGFLLTTFLPQLEHSKIRR